MFLYGFYFLCTKYWKYWSWDLHFFNWFSDTPFLFLLGLLHSLRLQVDSLWLFIYFILILFFLVFIWLHMLSCSFCLNHTFSLFTGCLVLASLLFFIYLFFSLAWFLSSLPTSALIFLLFLLYFVCNLVLKLRLILAHFNPLTANFKQPNRKFLLFNILRLNSSKKMSIGIFSVEASRTTYVKINFSSPFTWNLILFSFSF
jgi:hypothetical protein